MHRPTTPYPPLSREGTHEPIFMVVGAIRRLADAYPKVATGAEGSKEQGGILLSTFAAMRARRWCELFPYAKTNCS